MQCKKSKMNRETNATLNKEKIVIVKRNMSGLYLNFTFIH